MTWQKARITDITVILKRFGYKASWDEWTSTELASQEKANEVWEANNAEFCEQNLNVIVRIVNEGGNDLCKVPKIEIIHFDRPSLPETNEKRVTSDIDVDFLDPVIFGSPRVAVENCTGTAKTTSVVTHAKRTGNPILSVCALRSKVATHFKDSSHMACRLCSMMMMASISSRSVMIVL